MLIRALDHADRGIGKRLRVDAVGPDLYERALTIVLRSAFLFAAERRNHPFPRDTSDDRHFSVAILHARLRTTANQKGEAFLERRFNAWCRLMRAFREVLGDRGHESAVVNDRIVLHLFDALDPFLLDCGDGNEERNIESSGRLYEEMVDYAVPRTTSGALHLSPIRGRRKTGTHYTPPMVAKSLVQSTLESLVYDNPTHDKLQEPRKARPAQELLALRICDPACGSGVLLIEACRYLAERLVEAWKVETRGTVRLPKVERDRIQLARRLIAQQCLFGVDKNPLAVELAKLSLWLFVGANDHPLTFLDGNLRRGDSLLGARPCELVASATGVCDAQTPIDRANSSKAPAFHWPLEFPKVFAKGGGFDAVLANPPWGQKAIGHSLAMKQFIRQHYPSSLGIYDLFRPFVERGVQLLADGGALGMVLPDIILLKDYPHTRRFLLDHLAIRSIDWWGQAFAAAAIDTVTLVGIRAPAPPDHKLQVRLHHRGSLLHRQVAQASFRFNPKCVFNLHITETAQKLLDHLRDFPTVGDFFEMHEGVHSGNIRSDLFVDKKRDATCKEMYFGRDEIRPYSLMWQGRFIRLSALPKRESQSRYANAGRFHWFEQPKILVRRTGDFVLAAPDFSGRHASNNFFVVLAKAPCALDLFGLCAMLNSRFMTWFFRTIEPRQGRLFAELKIKHLRRFPLPERVTSMRTCRRLNDLGSQRARLAKSAANTPHRIQEILHLARAIDRAVARLLGVEGLLPDPM